MARLLVSMYKRPGERPLSADLPARWQWS